MYTSHILGALKPGASRVTRIVLIASGPWAVAPTNDSSLFNGLLGFNSDAGSNLGPLDASGGPNRPGHAVGEVSDLVYSLC